MINSTPSDRETENWFGRYAGEAGRTSEPFFLPLAPWIHIGLPPMTADVHPLSSPPELMAGCADARPGEDDCTATDVGSIAPAVRQTPQQACLMLWKDVLLENVRSRQPDLTNRQMAVLQVVYTSKQAQTVGSLVAALALPGPAVSRSVIALKALGYLKRSSHPTDARCTLMKPTAPGAVFLEYLAATIAKATNRCETVGPQDSGAAAVS